jgi:hypothetical protein
MTYFNNSTEYNNIQPLSANTFDIDLQDLRMKREQTIPYHNKTKDQYSPHAHLTPTKQNELYTSKSDQLFSINNIPSTPTNISNSKIMSSEEK